MSANVASSSGTGATMTGMVPCDGAKLFSQTLARYADTGWPQRRVERLNRFPEGIRESDRLPRIDDGHRNDHSGRHGHPEVDVRLDVLARIAKRAGVFVAGADPLRHEPAL